MVLLGESPHYGQDAVPCLIRHRRDISRCSSPRARALHAGADGVDARAAAAAGVDYRRTGPLVCPYDPCPVIIDDRLLVFDTGHLNATTVRALAPGLRLLLRGMVGQ